MLGQIYSMSTRPWRGDLVEKYIARKLLLVVVILVTFGKDLHFFKWKKFKVIPVIPPLPLVFLNAQKGVELQLENSHSLLSNLA